MDALRVSLVVIGIILILAIYLYSRRSLNSGDKTFKIKFPRRWLNLATRLIPDRKNTPSSAAHQYDDPEPRLEPQISTHELSDIEEIVPSRSIVMDDVAAGIIANLLLRIIIYFL